MDQTLYARQVLERQHKGIWPSGPLDRLTKRVAHPCIQCGYKVTGSYQCGTCWGNIHVKCGKPAQLGQCNPRICKWCEIQGPLHNPPLPPSFLDEGTAPSDRMYNATDSRLMRCRLFPCPGCELAADDSHQCQVCFRHIIHQLPDCSNSVVSTEEGAGMPRMCFTCSKEDSSLRLTSPSCHSSTIDDEASLARVPSVPIFDMQSPDVLPNPPPAPQASEDRAGGWHVTPCPDSFFVHLDVVDRSQIHDYRLETHCILEKAMQQLYPGWRHQSRKKYLGADGDTRVRKIGDLSVGDCCPIFYNYDSLIGPLWRQVQLHKTTVHLEPRDMIGFIMVVSYLRFYGCSSKAYFDNQNDMLKQLRPDWAISRDKFSIAILNAFKAKDMVNRRFINELQSTQRMQWGKLLFHPEFGSYSLDDDKLDARSATCDDEGLVSSRHDSSGGLGPVVHTLVSQLTGFVIGTAMNAIGGGDGPTILELLRGISDIDAHEAIRLKLDRGYARKYFDQIMESVNARRSGTQPRPSSKGDFPWTYGHPGRDYDVSIVPQAAYTEFAVRRRTFFKQATQEARYIWDHA
jgi:hypothetical protein